MTQSAKVTRTEADEWQSLCLDWARAGERFEVQNVGAKHLAFCNNLTLTHDYDCHYDSMHQIAFFVPAT